MKRRYSTCWICRKNPWFKKNLPAYLRPLPNTEESGNLLIDDDLVFELSKKMGYSTQVIQKALSEPDNNQFKVAYQLVVDHKRLLQDCKLAWYRESKPATNPGTLQPRIITSKVFSLLHLHLGIPLWKIDTRSQRKKMAIWMPSPLFPS